MPLVSADMVELVRFKHAPYPYVRTAAERQRFFDVIEGRRRGHTGRDGTVYWEDETYLDNRVLLAIPGLHALLRPLPNTASGVVSS